MYPLQSISMLTGLLYGLMAVTAWAMLLRRHPRIPTRLALRNLLRNAFMHGGSGVQVGLQLSESADPPALLISLIDNGPGLDQAGLAGHKHRGLGLNIARQVAQLHGGRLALEAQPGGGLAARLVLPLPGQDDGPR